MSAVEDPDAHHGEQLDITESLTVSKLLLGDEDGRRELTLWAAFEWSYTPPKNAVVASLPIILTKR